MGRQSAATRFQADSSAAAWAAAVLAAAVLCGCQSSEERACVDTARLDMPVDLAQFDAQGTVWPHGSHGAAHPEGHPGLDFNLSAASAELPVHAPIGGEIVATTPEESNPGSSCLILDSACIQVNFCHIKMEPGLKEGSRVKRGQLLGKVVPVPGGGAYSLHFGTYVRSGEQQVCPADFLDPDSVRCLVGEVRGGNAPSGCGTRSGRETLMSRSAYPESDPRELTLACADGTRKTFELPSENRLCNSRLPEAMRKAIEACMGPGCAGVW